MAYRMALTFQPVTAIPSGVLAFLLDVILGQKDLQAVRECPERLIQHSPSSQLSIV